ncbi:MAG: SDR family oxidoreductase [Bacteroidia bacterium]
MKKIFISGASRGIGLAIARIFYQAGFETIICSRNPQKLAEAKAEMPNLHTFVCDISDKEAIKNMANLINEQFGALDILVNNVGLFELGNIHEGSETLFELLMKTNFESAYYLTKSVLPLMIAQKKGTIFNICSTSSIKINEKVGLYTVSKYALLGFAKVLREEMKAHNIRVINLLPGSTKTDSWEGIPISENRLIPKEDVAKILFEAYHLSDRTVVEEIVLRPVEGDV